MRLYVASPFVFLMKSIVHIFIQLSLCLTLVCACQPDPVSGDGDDHTQDPSIGVIDPEASPSHGEAVALLTVNSTTYGLSSAGYYHDAARKGFSFVFTESLHNLSSPLKSLPEGALFYVDLPEIDMNTTSNLPTIIQGDEWEFYFGYGFDGRLIKVDNTFEIRSSSIKEGKIFINLAKGELSLDFQAKLNNGDFLKLEYFGKPSISNDYIIDWYPLVITNAHSSAR